MDFSMRVLRVIVTVQVLFGTIYCQTNLQTFVYASRGERRVKNYYRVSQHVLRSKVECITKCTITSGCTGLSWKPSINTCLLTNGDTAAFGFSNNRFQGSANWEAMIKVMYPVAFYSGGSSKFTFNEAVSRCELAGTTVASQDDLLHARSLGFQKCICGWMAEEIIGYVMQEQSSGCGGIFNMCGGDKSDVYCRLAEYIYPSD